MLYGCETWSLTLREESRLRVFENRILRRIFGLKRMGSGDGSTMRNFIVCTVHLNIVRVNKSRRLRWAEHVARVEEDRSAFKILTSKPIGKRTLGRPRCRYEDNIRMELEEIGINAVNWVDSAHDRKSVESPPECGIEPPGFINHGVS